MQLINYHALLITRQQILDYSKLKEFADDNFKFHENERKLSKQVENTMGKGEIALYEQFLLFPQCFQKACFQGVIVWEWVNCLSVKSLKTMLKKNDNAAVWSPVLFLHSPECFQTHLTSKTLNILKHMEKV